VREKLAGGVAGAIAPWDGTAQWFRLWAVLGSALGFVGSRTARKASVRRLIAGGVPAAFASGSRTFQFLTTIKVISVQWNTHTRVSVSSNYALLDEKGSAFTDAAAMNYCSTVYCYTRP